MAEANNAEARAMASSAFVPRPLRLVLPLLLLLSQIAGVPVAAAQPMGSLPESRHFETTKFLIGLRQQGLFDLQAAYMQAYPPTSVAERAWYDREQKLGAAFRPDVPIENRLETLKAADADAVKAVASEADSPRSVLWRIDLAQTWFYGASRPLFEQVLFYGRTASLKQSLKLAASSAMAAYDEAMTSVDSYLEQLSNAHGQAPAVQHLNVNLMGMSQQIQFERCWAQLHLAMAMDRTDIDQGLLAGRIMRRLQDLHLLDPTDSSGGTAAQALLMAAMISRLQSDWPAAQDYLGRTDKALRSAAGAEAQGLEWVWFAAQVERGRLLLDQGQFSKAAGFLAALRKSIQDNSGLDATVKVARSLSLAMVQFEALSLAADAAAAKGDQNAQRTYAAQRFEAVAKLAGEAPGYRQTIYQMVADRMPDAAGVAGLPPFGKAVFAARWLTQKKYEPALAAAEALDRETASQKNYLNQDAIYFQAVCLQNLKRTIPAAQAYLRLARDYPQDKRAVPAAQACMYLLSADKAAIDSAAGRAVFVQAGQILLRSSPEFLKKQNWVLPLAEAALEEKRYDRAIELFEMVPRDSSYYAYAMAGRIRAMVGRLGTAGSGRDPAEVRREAESAVAEAMALAENLTSGKVPTSQPAQDGQVLAGQVLLAAAQLCVDPLGDPKRALKMLEGMEDRWKQQPAMLAQLVTVRIAAMQKEGDLSQAGPMVDRMVTVNPQAAGAMVVSLLAQIEREIEQQKAEARTDMGGLVTLAVSLAQRLDKWAQEHPGTIKDESRYAIRCRLARTLLAANQAEQALPLFDALAKEDAQRSGGQAKDATVLEGQAACLFALQRWPEAREAYQGIWRRSQVRSELWWRAVLRSLQCSVNLNEDPQKILRVIRQHQALYPDMGGPEMSKQFEEMAYQMVKKGEHTQTGKNGSK